MEIGGCCASHHGAVIRYVGLRLVRSWAFIALAYPFYLGKRVKRSLWSTLNVMALHGSASPVPPISYSVSIWGFVATDVSAVLQQCGSLVHNKRPAGGPFGKNTAS